MKTTTYIIALLTAFLAQSQTALQNNGAMQLHSDAKVGFHTNLINNGTLENNLGMVGFYSDNEVRTVSGTNHPVFYNVDVNTYDNNLVLETSLGVTNDFNFVEGKVRTPRDNTSVTLDFIGHDFIIGEVDSRHVDGYASVNNYNLEFTFPIGHDDRLRKMILPAQTSNTYFKGAYFFEDPNNPSTFSTNFDTSKTVNTIKAISNQEFWDLDGTTKTTITLTWDEQSNITFLAEDLSSLRVVGWNKNTNQWDDLGNTNTTGNDTIGTITSNLFLPDTYEIITIGSIEDINTITCNANYLISPNGDGLGDSLEIDCLKDYPKESALSVYNRWGNLVFKSTNRQNKWQGKSNARATVNADKSLPSGTYFYILKYGKDYKQLLKGWVYLNK